MTVDPAAIPPATINPATGDHAREVAVVRGRCPTAWQPMAAGDGLLVRIRPRLGRLTREQLLVLCDTALAHGNGQLDLTSRAGIQLRGVGPAWEAAIRPLVAAGLVPPDAAGEAAPALLVAPDWRAGDDTHRVAAAILAGIATLPALPGKIGIAVDAGAAAVLTEDPADFRIERGADGGLILRADGRPGGVALAPDAAIAALCALAEWFVDSGGPAAGRMARHHAPLPGWARGTIPPLRAAGRLRPGLHPLGAVITAPFGRIAATRLRERAARAGVRGLRLTPWRLAILEGAAPDPAADDADTPLLAVDACVGAPACPQATVATRPLAERLAPLVRGSLHVSGCAKGCARARPAGTVLTGRDGRFDLAYQARAGGVPAIAGLDPDQLPARFGNP